MIGLPIAGWIFFWRLEDSILRNMMVGVVPPHIDNESWMSGVWWRRISEEGVSTLKQVFIKNQSRSGLLVISQVALSLDISYNRMLLILKALASEFPYVLRLLEYTESSSDFSSGPYYNYYLYEGPKCSVHRDQTAVKNLISSSLNYRASDSCNLSHLCCSYLEAKWQCMNLWGLWIYCR